MSRCVFQENISLFVSSRLFISKNMSASMISVPVYCLGLIHFLHKAVPNPSRAAASDLTRKKTVSSRRRSGTGHGCLPLSSSGVLLCRAVSCHSPHSPALSSSKFNCFGSSRRNQISSIRMSRVCDCVVPCVIRSVCVYFISIGPESS